MHQRPLVLSFAVAAALTSCGGGDSATGTIEGLQGPQQVSIIDSNSTVSAVRLPRGVSAVTGSDYETDQTRFWVRDDSMKVLDTVNMILSSLDQTRYWEQTNAGAYRALVEEEETGGGERGNQGPVYKVWTVDSSRASSSAPQVVKFWLDETDAMGTNIPAIIYGRLTVTAEPSDTNPLGSFNLFFKCLPVSEASTSTATMFEGYMRTVARTDGQSEIEFFNGHGDPEGAVGSGDYATRERVHVVANRTAGTGRAYAEFKFVQNDGSQTNTDAGEYQLQFNDDYVALRDVTNSNALKVLDRNDFTTRVFRYGVYDNTTEERIAQLSGFPVQDSNGNNGWAGFHGIWFPGNVTLTDGQTLLRRSFQDNSTTPYTLVLVDGKLQKRTRSAITLADVQDEDLEYFTPGAGGEMKVRFTGSDFVKVAERQSGQWQSITPVSIASSFVTGQWVNCWSQARGNVEFAWPASLSGSVAAYVMQMTAITSDSAELANGDLTLHGYQRLLRANITSDQANYQNSESPYLPDASSTSSGNQTYVFDSETMLLTLGGNPCTLANGVTVTQGPNQNGLQCGPLFTTALSSFADIQNQTVTYEWVTGGNEWNQLRALKDGNDAFVDFDPPLRLTYVHSQNGSPFNGRTFFLEWDGANLGGIPFEQNQTDFRWYPLLNIPSATVLTGGGSSYKVKQLEGEQIMVEVGSPSTVYAAEGFDLDAETLTAPTIGDWQDPAIGTRPTVTAAPLYVAGVRQGT